LNGKNAKKPVVWILDLLLVYVIPWPVALSDGKHDYKLLDSSQFLLIIFIWHYNNNNNQGLSH